MAATTINTAFEVIATEIKIRNQAVIAAQKCWIATQQYMLDEQLDRALELIGYDNLKMCIEQHHLTEISDNVEIEIAVDAWNTRMLACANKREKFPTRFNADKKVCIIPAEWKNWLELDGIFSLLIALVINDNKTMERRTDRTSCFNPLNAVPLEALPYVMSDERLAKQKNWPTPTLCEMPSTTAATMRLILRNYIARHDRAEAAWLQPAQLLVGSATEPLTRPDQSAAKRARVTDC
jgi:hypothetical protein